MMIGGKGASLILYHSVGKGMYCFQRHTFVVMHSCFLFHGDDKIGLPSRLLLGPFVEKLGGRLTMTSGRSSELEVALVLHLVWRVLLIIAALFFKAIASSETP